MLLKYGGPLIALGIALGALERPLNCGAVAVGEADRIALVV